MELNTPKTVKFEVSKSKPSSKPSL